MAYPYPFPTFQQAMRLITSITNSNPAIVTTNINHQYNDGLYIRLNIPTGYGMPEANQLYAPIIVTGLTTFTIDIDTTLFTPFAYPVIPVKQFPQSIPIGELSNTLQNATRNVLPYPAQ